MCDSQSKAETLRGGSRSIAAVTESWMAECVARSLGVSKRFVELPRFE
jgi:hypothetical protein